MKNKRNNNFTECILKDSINLEFYYTDDNITYFSCKDIRFQNNEKCQELLKTTIPEIQTTIPNIQEITPTTQIIKSTAPTTNLIFPTTNALTTQLNQIPTTQKNNIPTTQIDKLETTQLNKIPTTQLNKIPTTHLNKITTTQIDKIQTTQIKIPTTQINNIPTTQLIKIITTQAEKISTTQIDSIPSTQLNKIPTTQVENIQTTQLNKITTTLLNNIPTTLIEKITITNLNEIQTTQINKITTTQMDKITTTHLNEIPTTQIDKISKTHLNKIPTTQIDKITTTQILQNPTTTMIHTTIIKKESPKIKEKVFFFLQVQIINRKIYIFLIINFAITKNTEFIFNITIYLSRNLRNLEENKVTKEISFHPKENYDGNGDKIVSLISDEEISDSRVVIKELKNAEDIEVKIAIDNSDLLDTQKVKEAINKGGVDFSKIAENGNGYTISQYKILSSSSGCEFALTSESKISQKNKIIELSFIEAEINNNNIITAKCILSSMFDKKIMCKLDKEINNEYILQPYIFSDETETITIVQKDTNDYLSLQCESTEISLLFVKKPKKEGGLSTGAIILLIVGLILLAVAVVVGVIIYKKKSSKDKKNEIPVDSKIAEYPSIASNVNL